jgi:hypothetical protein
MPFFFAHVEGRAVHVYALEGISVLQRVFFRNGVRADGRFTVPFRGNLVARRSWVRVTMRRSMRQKEKLPRYARTSAAYKGSIVNATPAGRDRIGHLSFFCERAVRTPNDVFMRERVLYYGVPISKDWW